MLLKQAVALAPKDNPSPSVSDFAAAAAKKVVPQFPRKKHIAQEPLVPKIQEPMVPQKAIVTVSQQSHPRFGDSAMPSATRSENALIHASLQRLSLDERDRGFGVTFPSWNLLYPQTGI